MLPPPFCPCYGDLSLAKQSSTLQRQKFCFFAFHRYFSPTLQIAIIHPQQPLRHCRAPCQGCNAADSDLWYNLPDIFDEAIATQCAARMVIGTFTASSFFHNQSLKLLADHTVPRGGIQRTQELSLNFCILLPFIVRLLPTKILVLPIRSRVKLQPYRLDSPDLYRLGGKKDRIRRYTIAALFVGDVAFAAIPRMPHDQHAAGGVP